MTIRAKLISLFWSSDFWVGFGAAALYIIAAPDQVTLIAAKDILSICVSVLAIVFSVFFAAVAIVMTAGDNEFVLFLEKKGMYTHIIWTFQATLVLLLVALIASISFYIALLLTPNPELDSTLSVSKCCWPPSFSWQRGLYLQRTTHPMMRSDMPLIEPNLSRYRGMANPQKARRKYLLIRIKLRRVTDSKADN